ncbi:MAG: amidohydrolase family protein, partial [Alphaproteobacteria bacterium]
TGPVLERASIVIEDGVIREVAERDVGAPTHDLAGKTVIPGLIDGHAHILFSDCPSGVSPVLPRVAIPGKDPDEQEVYVSLLEAPARARAYLAAGITTVRDLGGATDPVIAVREAIAARAIPGPRMLVAGRIVTITGGIAGRGPSVLFADGADGLRKAARAQMRAGVDLVKLYASRGILGPLLPGEVPGSPTLSEDEMRAAVEEAHNAGKRVAAHAHGAVAVKMALRAGVDSIEHGTLMDEDSARMMADRGVFYLPTLESLENVIRLGTGAGFPAYYFENAKNVVERHRRAFALARAAGLRIVAGSDSGAEGAPPHGQLAMELEALARLGMSPKEALASATVQAAELLGRPELGAIERGKVADLVVLDRDPIEDISAVRDVHLVVKDGVLYRPEQLRAL